MGLGEALGVGGVSEGWGWEGVVKGCVAGTLEVDNEGVWPCLCVPKCGKSMKWGESL